MLVRVNGEARELPSWATVASVMDELDVSPQSRGVAVALDGEVVPRGRWSRTELCDGARVEIVVAVQGG